MSCRDSHDRLDNEKFCAFLEKITAFIWASAILMPNTYRLRTPLFREMVRIVKGADVSFAGHKFDAGELRSAMFHYNFSGKKKITRSMLAW